MSIIQKWHTEWFDYIKKIAVTPYEWKDVVSNPNFLPEFIITYPQYMTQLNWLSLGSNPNLTIKFILDHPEFIEKWDWRSVSMNKNMTPSIISSNPTLNWDWKFVSQNTSVMSDTRFLTEHFSKLRLEYILPNVSFDFIQSNFLVLSYFKENRFWESMSQNPNITTDLLLMNQDKSWQWALLTDNAAISIDFIEAHKSMPWDWIIFQVSKMTISFYEKYRYINFLPKLNIMSLNPNMIELISSNPEWEWDWEKVSYNPGLKFSLVESFPEKPWDWYNLSQHPNITLEDILRRGDLPWSMYSLSWNVNICVAFIKRSFFQPWAKRYIVKNTMCLARERYISSEYTKMTKETKKKYEAQLMEVAWHPDRLEWVLDHEQQERYKIEKKIKKDKER